MRGFPEAKINNELCSHLSGDMKRTLELVMHDSQLAKRTV